MSIQGPDSTEVACMFVQCPNSTSPSFACRELWTCIPLPSSDTRRRPASTDIIAACRVIELSALHYYRGRVWLQTPRGVSTKTIHCAPHRSTSSSLDEARFRLDLSGQS